MDPDIDDYADRSGTPFGPLLLVVFTSILEVFLLCLAGYILAGRGILDKKTQKQLNRLNVSLFTPALLFSKVAFFLSPEKLRELWTIPIFFVIVTTVSMSVAYILGSLLKLKKSQRSFAMAAAMFMNSNSLPIALMQSLVVTVPDLRWDEYDSKDSMLGRALTYLVLYSTLGMVLRWSYGVRLLTQADTENVATTVTSTIADERSPLLGSYSHEDIHVSHPSSAATMVESDGSEADTRSIVSQPEPRRLRPPPRRRTTFYKSFPNSPNQSRMDLAAYGSVNSSLATSPAFSDAEDDNINQGAPHVNHARSSLPVHVRSSKSPGVLRRLGRVKRKIARGWATLNEFMTVPLWAALASLIVACIGPLQHALDHDMQPVKGAISSAGSCSIPVTLVVLGAYFYPAPKDSNNNEPGKANGLSTAVTAPKSLLDRIRSLFHLQPSDNETPKNKTSRPGETKTVLVAVVSRMIITPLLLMPIMLIVASNHRQAVFDDPIFILANVLLISSPPALTLAQITQAASGDAFERLISRTIFWAYCIVTPPATILYVLLGLMVAKF